MSLLAARLLSRWAVCHSYKRPDDSNRRCAVSSRRSIAGQRGTGSASMRVDPLAQFAWSEKGGYEYVSIMRAAAIAVLVCAVSHVGYAGTRPDFSGNWILSKSKSKQRDSRQFKRQTMEVSKHDPDLSVDIRDQQPDGHEFRAYLNLKTDGTPTVAILGSPQRAVIRWKGNSMVIRWNLDGTASSSGGGSGRQGATPPFTWIWTLSPNGNALVNDSQRGA